MKTQLLAALALCALPAFAATPAELAIQHANREIAAQPKFFGHYNDLAMAYARRARETGDAQYLAQADEALHQSLAISAGNFDALKAQALVELDRHEYAAALELATQLNRRVPDDVAVYGYLADANAGLGNYQDAIDAAQWMLDLRSNNTASLLHAAVLRELYGKLAGSLELLETAYSAISPAESEDRAWIKTRMSHIELLSGNLAQAESDANQALAMFQGYHLALDALAQVRMAQGRYSDAAALFQKRYQALPRAANLYALAGAQQLAGDRAGAEASFRSFETMARAEWQLADNSNRELVDYYAERGEAAKALEIARGEIARHHDIGTLDSYAWALAAGGDYAEADRQMQIAMQTGTKDPEILYHAGAIALHLHQNDRAEGFLKDAAARYSREAAALLARAHQDAPSGER